MTRKLLFSLLLLLLASSPKAQYILNGGFEDTTFTVNDTLPTHWSGDFLGFAFTSDAHSGASAATIWNWYSYAKGWLVYGAATTPTDEGQGHPISINPDRLTGFYKYIYDDNGGALDSATCEILIYSHQNFTGARDTLAHVLHKFGPEPEYTAFEIPITYDTPGIVADSILVRFHSSESGFCNPSTECLYLYLDDLEVSTATGTIDLQVMRPAVSLYPTPSMGGFRIAAQDAAAFPCTVDLFDLSGRKVYATTVLGESAQEIHPHLPAGNYTWTITSRLGERHHGKWQCQ